MDSLRDSLHRPAGPPSACGCQPGPAGFGSVTGSASAAASAASAASAADSCYAHGQAAAAPQSTDGPPPPAAAALAAGLGALFPPPSAAAGQRMRVGPMRRASVVAAAGAMPAPARPSPRAGPSPINEA